MARYPYLGSARRIYTQYTDITGGGSAPLVAEPGGVYDMIPGPGQEEDLPVPPGDGLWAPGVPGAAAPAAKAPAGKTASAGKGGDK